LLLISRAFDPLGLILPFTVSARFLFQDVWRLGLEWDEELPPELRIVFAKWLENMNTLKALSIPRKYFSSGTWLDTVSHLEVHAFGDASLRGYGSCVYLIYCDSSGKRQSVLVRSCARVAPLERKTLPRLELLSCLITAQLLAKTLEALKLDNCVHDVKYSCWTDSMVALGWIHGSPSKWKPWVANRVAAIQSLTNPIAWKHVSGVDNPADMLSRGVTGDVLVHLKMWWNGLSFLSDDSVVHEVPICFPENNSDVVAELKAHCSNVLLSGSSVRCFEMERWSTLCKAYRIIAWVMRFIKNARVRCGAATQGDRTSLYSCLHGCKKMSGPLTQEELLT
jgi:hypothetical protein